jgi:hypothetical protein
MVGDLTFWQIIGAALCVLFLVAVLAAADAVRDRRKHQREHLKNEWKRRG